MHAAVRDCEEAAADAAPAPMLSYATHAIVCTPLASVVVLIVLKPTAPFVL
jgi:hypothetical protein